MARTASQLLPLCFAVLDACGCPAGEAWPDLPWDAPEDGLAAGFCAPGDPWACFLSEGEGLPSLLSESGYCFHSFVGKRSSWCLLSWRLAW